MSNTIQFASVSLIGVAAGPQSRSMWRKFIRISPWVATVVLISSCARSVPLISHAHIGHTLTAWHDTPENSGLFLVAEKETDNAKQEYSLASVAKDTPALAKVHVKNIIHSLNPDLQATGTGSGYGAVRALQGSIDHVKFAAVSEDASTNLRQSTKKFESHAQATLDQLLVALATARLVMAASDENFSKDLLALGDLLSSAVVGQDLDSDGVIGNQVGESGLQQLRAQLSDMLANEVAPPYHPVGRRYLFGMVKLPNGRWVYKFNRSGNGDAGSEGGAGGGSAGGAGGGGGGSGY